MKEAKVLYPLSKLYHVGIGCDLDKILNNSSYCLVRYVCVCSTTGSISVFIELLHTYATSKVSTYLFRSTVWSHSLLSCRPCSSSHPRHHRAVDPPPKCTTTGPTRHNPTWLPNSVCRVWIHVQSEDAMYCARRKTRAGSTRAHPYPHRSASEEK